MPSAHRAPIAFPLPDDLTGRRIGRFTILRRIGSGGMGEVYYAEDTGLKRPVALKRVTRRLRNDPDARQHILREAQRASSLSSNHIASVYDVVEDHGELLLVMEYVEGTNLRERLHRCSPLAPELCLRIAIESAEALADAHSKGIVHRDIKPENIMLTAADDVKVLDFGLALRLRTGDPRAVTVSAETEEFGMAGTPAYMAPEVLLGEEVDGRTDIFSLGVVLYETLTGQHPFATRQLISTADQILHHEPRPATKFLPALSPAFDHILERMLAKQPSNRYQNARELLDDLQSLAQPNRTGSHFLGIRSRSKRITLLAALATVLLAAAVTLAIILIHRSGAGTWGHHDVSTSNVLVADFESIGDSSIPDKAVRELFSTALQQSHQINLLSRARVYDALRRMQRTDVTRIDENTGREICRRENANVLLAGSIAQIDDTFQISIRAVDPIAGTALFTENARVQQKAKLFDAVESLAQRVRKRLGEPQAHIEEHSQALAKVTTNSLEALQLYSQAMDLMAQGKHEVALGLFQSATNIDANFAMAHLGLSDCYSAVVGRTENALKEVRRAYDLRANVTERERLVIEAAYYNLAEDYERSAQALKTLADLYPDDGSAHQLLAAAYDNLGRFKEALAEQQQALRLDPNSATGYITLILWLARSNQNDAAIKEYEAARAKGIDSPYLRWGRGMAYFGEDDLTNARKEFEALRGGSSTEAELGSFYLAMLDVYQGKLQLAETRLTARLQDSKGSTAGFATVNLYQIARIRLLSGDPAGAQRHADAILSMPSTDIQVIDYRDAARVLLLAGNVKRARTVLPTLQHFAETTPNAWNEAAYRLVSGEIMAAEGDWDGGQSSFEAALRAYPEPDIHLDLARLYAQRQDWQHAIQLYEAFLGDKGNVLQHGFPADLVTARLELARAYRRTGDYSHAESEYQSIARIWRDGDNFPLRRQALDELSQMHADSR